MIDISVTDLVKSFDLEKKILDGVSFQIDTGERVGLLGKNGAGKSTLFNILTGELDYDSGQVLIAPGRGTAIPRPCGATASLPPGSRAWAAMTPTPPSTRSPTACPSTAICGSGCLTSCPAGRKPG